MENTEIEIVVKRDGKESPWSLSKWQAQIAKVCRGIADVSPSMIELNAQREFKNRMTTRELDEIALKSMVNLIDETERPDEGNTNYQFVAGKQRVAMLRKDVYGKYTPPPLIEIVRANVARDMYTEELLEWYSEAEWAIMDAMVNHAKDEKLPFAAIQKLCDSYLVQNRVTGVIYESPQVRYIIAAATAFHAEKTDVRLQYVKDFYDYASDGAFTLATPVLAGLGTKTKQFSSCVLIKSDDTLDSIFASGQAMANYASKKAGIGLDTGMVRPMGAEIRKGEIKHTGHIPFLKKWFGDLRSCSQGGIRNAACTITYPIWHYEFEDLIVLKNNQGTEENRVRHMDYSVGMNAFFWKRFGTQGVITFFDPNQVPDLYVAFHANQKEFVRLYEHYEANAKELGLRTKQKSAEEVIVAMLITERTGTGRIYILNVDNANAQGPLDPAIHPIYQSNLCQEIMLHTRPFQTVDDKNGRIALCTLGSINMGYAQKPEEIRGPIRILQRSLHNLLQYQTFLTVQSELHNKEFEPLGMGITNLAYWLAKQGLKYGEPDALAAFKDWMEHMSFYATEGTVDLAEEKGACTMSHTTSYGKGIFIHEKRAPGVNELTDFTPNPNLGWETLRPRMIKFGVRNTTNLALPPVESSSVAINSTNGFAMIKATIVEKGGKQTVVQVVPEYRKLKDKYQLMWDQEDCLPYLKQMAVAQVYTDQGMSADTFYNPKFFPGGKIPVTLVLRNLMLCHQWGYKSHYYSLINKQALMDSLSDASAASLTRIQGELPLEPVVEVEEEFCESCVL